MNTATSTSRLRTRALLIAGAIAVVAIAVFAAVFAYNRGDDSGSATDAEVQALYDRMLAAMTREGMVLHVTVRGQSCGRVESWIEPAEEAIRDHQYTCLNDVDPDTRTIYRNGDQWQVSAAGFAWRGLAWFGCTSLQHEAVEFFVPCNWLEEDPVDYAIRKGARFEGRAAIEIRVQGEHAGVAYKTVEAASAQGVDTRVEFDDRLYLDEATGLPLALSQKRRGDGGESEHEVTLYQTEFVERASLGDDYFKPRGIGYVRDVFPDLGPVDVRDLRPRVLPTPNP